jgi:VanZ family protein
VVVLLLWSPNVAPPAGLALPERIDLALHLVLFLPIGILVPWGRLVPSSPTGHGLRELLWTLLWGGGLGLLTEVGQTFVPGRTPAVGDWLFDCAGVAAGCWLTRRRRVEAATEAGAGPISGAGSGSPPRSGPSRPRSPGPT